MLAWPTGGPSCSSRWSPGCPTSAPRWSTPPAARWPLGRRRARPGGPGPCCRRPAGAPRRRRRWPSCWRPSSGWTPPSRRPTRRRGFADRGPGRAGRPASAGGRTGGRVDRGVSGTVTTPHPADPGRRRRRRRSPTGWPAPGSPSTTGVVGPDRAPAAPRCAPATADRAEAGRDWWPLAIGWAARGQVPARPAVVVRPTDADQVAAVLAACSAAGVPVTAVAGRSGVCGGRSRSSAGWPST